MSRLLLFLMLLAGLVNTSQAQPGSLNELLEQVRNMHLLDKKENQAREEKFRQEHSSQKQLLLDAKKLLDAEEKRSDALRAIYEQNERQIDSREVELSQKMGSLGEMHGIVRQIANELDAIIDTSLVSAQIPDRDEVIDKLADSKALPSLDELVNLWHVALEEMAEAGNVVTFPARIITANGDELEQNVTRIGVFNAVSKGRFLRFLPEAEHLIEPGKQPAERYRDMAISLEQSTEGIMPFPVDPTRGAMLALLVQVPELTARIKQGGLVGIIIIAVGIIGLLIAAVRYIQLSRIDQQVSAQMNSDKPSDNPLGRIIAVYQSNTDVDTETLGLKLDEAILREMPVLQRGLRVIALLGEIALLLGLLGTVTGIIGTFQSITLFGTGDPRVMSGGISQALVTTVMGLSTAIPLLLIHSFLVSKSNRLIHILDEKSAAFVAKLAEARLNK